MSAEGGVAVPRYPRISVQLVGQDGNALSIIGRVSAAMRRGGVESALIDEFVNEATSGDYDNVIATAGRWVEVY